MGVIAPAKLPRRIAARLNAEITALVAEPAVVERIRTMGSEPKSGPPEDFKAASPPTSRAGPRWSPTPGIERI